MNLNVFNASLLLSWLMVSLGAIAVSVPLGIIVSGAVLMGLTLFVGAKFGVYQIKKDGAE